MIKRIVALLLAGLVVLGSALAFPPDDPGTDDPEPPIRLKKKKPVEKVEPGKIEPGTKETDKKPPEKAKEKEDEPLVPEDGRGGEPQEDEKELLDRIGRSMRAVEEKLANKEIGEPTRQRQEDILRDLDALIKKSEQQSGGGGGGGQDQQPQGGEKGGSEAKGGGSQPKGGAAQKGGGAGQKGGQSQASARRRGQRSGSRSGSQGMASARPSGSGSEPEKGSGSGTGGSGTQGGAGKGGPQGPKDRTADLYKDVWGHLPESLRAEMNAYSNPSPFLPKYDDLIKKYYRTLAEQGRRKGD